MKKMRLVLSNLAILACMSMMDSIPPASAQGGPECPAVVTSLMPGNAVKVTGQYTKAGVIGIGFATAWLPFKNICVNQVTQNPGKISFDIKHFSGEGLQLFKMQIGPEEEQRKQSKLSGFEGEVRSLKTSKNKMLLSVTPVNTETVSGGTLSYYGYETDCSEGEKRSKPTTFLHAVAHNESTAINLEIEGNISVDAAREAATDVLRNFAKADFSTLEK